MARLKCRMFSVIASWVALVVWTGALPGFDGIMKALPATIAAARYWATGMVRARWPRWWAPPLEDLTVT